MLNFSWATDLDPKGANNHIKEAIDRRYVTDEEDQEHSLSVDASICKLIYYTDFKTRIFYTIVCKLLLPCVTGYSTFVS